MLRAFGNVRSVASRPIIELHAEERSSKSASESQSTLTTAGVSSGSVSTSRSDTGINDDAATADTSSTLSERQANMAGKASGSRVEIRSRRTAKIYLSPRRAPCLTSQEDWYRSLTRMWITPTTPSSPINPTTAPRHWEHVSRTGATTWSLTKSPKRSNAKTETRRRARSSIQVVWARSDYNSRIEKLLVFVSGVSQTWNFSREGILHDFYRKFWKNIG